MGIGVRSLSVPDREYMASTKNQDGVLLTAEPRECGIVVVATPSERSLEEGSDATPPTMVAKRYRRMRKVDPNCMGGQRERFG